MCIRNSVILNVLLSIDRFDLCEGICHACREYINLISQGRQQQILSTAAEPREVHMRLSTAE
jgi:hypothetical protein